MLARKNKENRGQEQIISMDNNQAKIDIYLTQPSVRMVLDMLSLKYDFVVDELAKSILEGELLSNEAVEFLVEEFDFDLNQALAMVDQLSENVIEPFYVDSFDEGVMGKAIEKPIVRTEPQKTNWKDFIRPKVLQVGMEELGKASSGDVSRIRNYLWKHLGLGKPEEVVVVLSWLATTGELVKLWQEDNRFRGILKKYISIQYSDDISEKAVASKVTPALLGLSLRMILKDKLSLSAQDSAMVAMAIIDQMPEEEKPKYILIAYVDAINNSFNWNQIYGSAQGLQLAM